MSGHYEKGQTDDSKTKMKDETQADYQQQGAHVGSIDLVSGSHNPIIVGSQVTYNFNNAPPPERADAASHNPQSGNPTSGAWNAPHTDWAAVKPDCKGSYAALKMKTARLTMEMLNQENTYQLTSKCKGLAFILNNIDFNQGMQRKGSQIDMENMKHLFKELGYTAILHENLKGEDITKFFKEFASMFNHTGVSYDSAVIALMSLGHTGVIVGIDDVQVKLRDLQRELEPHKCPGLDGKPKMFFVQACRGSAQESNQLLEDTFIADIGNPADVYFAYATTDGYLSLRNTVGGSFFVQALCEVFFARAHLDKLDTLMTKVRARVNSRKGMRYDKKLERVPFMQTPECVNRMLKDVYFFPNYP